MNSPWPVMDSIDYSSFLLSCSPPQFDASLFNCSDLLEIISSENRPTQSDEEICQVQCDDLFDDEVAAAVNASDDNDGEFCGDPFEFAVERESPEQRKKRIKAWESNYEHGSTVDGSRKVNFADESGLDLTEEIDDDVTFSDERETFRLLSDETTSDGFSDREISYDSNFSLSTCEGEFAEKLSRQNICLERFFVATRSIRGVVWVCDDKSTDDDDVSSTGNGHKRVAVRYTFDGWLTFCDLEASYVGEGRLPLHMRMKPDKYEFKLENKLTSGGNCLTFAIRLKMRNGDEFWDNNGGNNFTVKLK